MEKPLISIRNLSVSFGANNSFLGKKQYKSVLDQLSLSVLKDEVLGIVGESGSGKSTLARTIMGLSSWSGNALINGEIIFNQNESDHQLVNMPEKYLRSLRKDIQMVFQDPYSSLNPRMTVAEQLSEPLIHGVMRLQRREALKRVEEILEDVGLSCKEGHLFPFQFSGGQRQRIAIARALVTSPSLLIADEPVSALDLSIQAQILNLLRELKKKYSLTIIFIAHDLGVVRYISDRMVVMYQGCIVEEGESERVFQNPAHPYTQLLLSSVPGVSRDDLFQSGKSIYEPSGEGCAFLSRCPFAMEKCCRGKPLLSESKSGRAACFLSGKEEESAIS